MLFLAACTTSMQTPEGMAVKLVDEKPQGCEYLDDVDTMDMAFDKDESVNYIRNRTARIGGDTARISRTINYSYGGAVVGSNAYVAHKAYMYKCGK